LGVQGILENTSRENFTLLLISAKFNNFETFKFLLNKGCNLYASCIKMQNSLHYAVINKNKEFIQFLSLYDAEQEILI
jgi:ankyrin repeat protein